MADGAFIATFRETCETSLYALAVGVLGYTFLTKTLHKPVCDWLQRVPPRRKMLLMPREHGKTTLGPRTLPIHTWIQPRERNIYFPGEPGANTRILLCGETESMAKGNLRVIRTHLEQNELLRALWPHIIWPRPQRDAKLWNDSEFIIPRPTEFAESSLDAVGVGGARTGKHPTIIMKDDITTEAAANSAVVMQTAIDWHVNTRALLPPHGLEFIHATYWTPDDLPHVVERDVSVAVNTKYRSITEDDKIIWPEYITPERVQQLMREYGPRFYLLYMNSVSDSTLTDFDVTDLRVFDLEGDVLTFPDDPRDTENPWHRGGPIPSPPTPTDPMDLRGRSLYDPVSQEALRRRAYRLNAR
jgi:hypothetical protein